VKLSKREKYQKFRNKNNNNMPKEKIYKHKNKNINKSKSKNNDNDKMNRNRISIWQDPNNKIMKTCYMKIRINNLNLFLLLLVSRMVQAKS
jgi:hypothetical protein